MIYNYGGRKWCVDSEKRHVLRKLKKRPLCSQLQQKRDASCVWCLYRRSCICERLLQLCRWAFLCLRQRLAPGAPGQGYILKQITQNFPRPPPLHRSLHRQQGASQLMQGAVCTRAGCVEDDLVCLTETYRVLSHKAEGQVYCKGSWLSYQQHDHQELTTT